jgi:hypothetical protein
MHIGIKKSKKNKGVGRKRDANGRKLDRHTTLISWSQEGCFESDHTGLPSSWAGGRSSYDLDSDTQRFNLGSRL